MAVSKATAHCPKAKLDHLKCSTKSFGSVTVDCNSGIPRKEDFETCIAACGYGRFHYLLLIPALVWVTCSQVFSTSVTAYILPVAECDLQLTEFQKGALNAAVYVGTIAGGLVWGAAGDKLGRRKIIVIGFLVEFLCSFLVGFANYFWLFLLLKVLGGLFLAAPNSLVYAYLAETHTEALRAKTIMWVGMGFTLAGVLHPVMAYLLIPLDFRVTLGALDLDVTPWRVFVILSSLPSLLAGLLCLRLPESPKFLMGRGRAEEALGVFRRIYSLNTGREPGTYPIASLECAGGEVSGEVKVRGQFGALLERATVIRLMGITIVHLGLMMTLNPVRMWTTQWFAILDSSTSSGPMCAVIAQTLEGKKQAAEALATVRSSCTPVNGEVFLRSVVINAVSTCSFLITGPLVGRLGKRMLLLMFFPSAAVLALAIPWAPNADWLMALLSAYTVLTANLEPAVAAVQVDLFPTSIRAMTYSIMTVVGRLGSFSANMAFPVLLGLSCQAALYFLSGCLLVCFVFSWILPTMQQHGGLTNHESRK